MNARIRNDGGKPVFGGEGFDDFQTARPKLGDKTLHAPRGSASGFTESTVDDECSSREGAGSGRSHHDFSFTVIDGSSLTLGPSLRNATFVI